jgi:hypothetical protein
LKNEELVYENPTNLFYYSNYNGDLYHIKSKDVDLSVTTNHRMYVSKQEGGKLLPYEFMEAKDVMGKKVRYKRTTILTKDAYNLELTGINIRDMDAWISFYAKVLCLGKIEKNRICIVQNNIYEANEINKLGFKYEIENLRQIIIKDENICMYFKQLNKEKLPEWVWKLNQRQSKLLLTQLVKHNNTIYTQVEKFADDIQRLCLHAGVIGDKKKYDYETWMVIMSEEKEEHISEINERMEKFNGEVFCLSVPSEIFYVRRNGKGVWTGNSRARGPRLLLTRQPPEGRARDGGLRLGEMERDALIAHGLAKFIKEKFLDNSDIYVTYICDKCGLFAQRYQRSDNEEIYYCKACHNFTDISKIVIPYAFKLFLQELMAMCVAPRIRTRRFQSS